jgi:hypothetical protein
MSATTIYENNNDNAEVKSSESNKSKRKAKEKVEKLLDKTEKPLFQIKAVFPFQLFPDSVIIDRAKVTYALYLFFYSRRYFPILIENIRTVWVTTNLFFGALTVEIKGLELRDQQKTVEHLWKADAIKAHRIITGLIAIHEEKIDITSLSNQEVLEMTEKIGLSRLEGVEV